MSGVCAQQTQEGQASWLAVAWCAVLFSQLQLERKGVCVSMSPHGCKAADALPALTESTRAVASRAPCCAALMLAFLLTARLACQWPAFAKLKQGKRVRQALPSDSYSLGGGATDGSKLLVPSIKSHKSIWCQQASICGGAGAAAGAGQSAYRQWTWSAIGELACQTGAASTPNACTLVIACLYSQQPSAYSTECCVFR